MISPFVPGFLSMFATEPPNLLAQINQPSLTICAFPQIQCRYPKTIGFALKMALPDGLANSHIPHLALHHRRPLWEPAPHEPPQVAWNDPPRVGLLWSTCLSQGESRGHSLSKSKTLERHHRFWSIFSIDNPTSILNHAPNFDSSIA